MLIPCSSKIWSVNKCQEQDHQSEAHEATHPE
jgi:hypothetical protein